VHASTAERFEQGYRAIATVLELPGWNDPKTDILDLVWRWLGDIRSGRWFMILDNTDDTDVFSSMPDKELEARSRPLSSYIPQTITGSVLLTTRDRRAASWLSTGYASAITVDLMTPEDAEQLLFTKIPDGISSALERAELVCELDYLPLAITQAAAYISARVMRMTVPRYLTLYRNDEVSQSRLLDEESGDLRRDPGVPNSVIRTWQISFDQIKEKWPSAAKLLSLIAMLDRQGIPDFLLHASYPDDLDLEAALSPLEEFSLISIERGGTRFEIHRLVQLATRKWLERYQELERWQEIAVKVVSNAFPDGDYKNWEICEALWPHAQEVLRSKFVSDTSCLAKAALLYHMGWYSWMQGRYLLASAQSQESLRIRERVLQGNDVEIFHSVGLLGLVLRYQGNYNEAETKHRRALEGYKIALGAEHPSTLTSMANLASTYQKQGRWKEAKDLFVQVMETSLRVLGAEHPSTLTSIANLASTYRNQGRWKEAEDLFVQVMETSLRVLGAEHPSTLTSIANLASTYQNQGRWKEAEDLEVQIMETSLRVLGAEHPSTLTSMANLASTYQNQGRWAEAEELQATELEICSRVLGQEHPDTLTSMANLALIWKGNSRDIDALKLMKQCAEARARILGANHPYTSSSRTILLGWQTEELEISALVDRE
jgi:tetratricopeptide (TPR) repeat protein